MRKRLTEAFDSHVARSQSNLESYQIGKLIERELGIDVVGHGIGGGYLNNDALFMKSQLSDLLDAITLIFRAFGNNSASNRAEKFLAEVRRIFAETGMAFRIDDKGGVHPLIDEAFEANRALAVRGLAGPQFVAARSAIESIDDALAENPQNFLKAVRNTFDAVENIFKQSFKGVTHLSKSVIDSHLRGLNSKPNVVPADDKLSFEKQITAFTNWVDSVHVYRHASGKPDPAPPSEDHAILLISSGVAYARWLAAIFKRNTAL